MGASKGLMKCPECEGQVSVYWDEATNKARVAHVGEACQDWLFALFLSEGRCRLGKVPESESSHAVAAPKEER